MKEFTIQSPCDGLPLACLCCEPEGIEPKGTVQLVHGMCEHKERYIPFMEWLAGNGYFVVINDHRGHGASVKSPEDLGYFYENGWQSMLKDTKAVTDWAKAKWPGKPFTLLGHSMGSMVVRSYAKRYDDAIDVLILSGCPSDNPGKGAGKVIAKMFGIFRGWHYRPVLLQIMSFGAYNKPFRDEGFKNAWVCSDKQVLKEYHNDPLCHYIFTANGFYNLMGLMQDCYGKKGWKMSRPDLPVHFISGAQDSCRISDKALEKARALMEKVGYKSVDLKLYPDMRHEILNESDKQVVWNDVLRMLA